ncbi:MAG: hypothetical protein KatS3mg123_2385 [Burkholderiales bacterium]|nr:MAG: hypothetical protein KatS3mg123_2385 [Burkholderiales bacterium]
MAGADARPGDALGRCFSQHDVHRAANAIGAHVGGRVVDQLDAFDHVRRQAVHLNLPLLGAAHDGLAVDQDLGEPLVQPAHPDVLGHPRGPGIGDARQPPEYVPHGSVVELLDVLAPVHQLRGGCPAPLVNRIQRIDDLNFPEPCFLGNLGPRIEKRSPQHHHAASRCRSFQSHPSPLSSRKSGLAGWPAFGRRAGCPQGERHGTNTRALPSMQSKNHRGGRSSFTPLPASCPGACGRSAASRRSPRSRGAAPPPGR